MNIEIKARCPSPLDVKKVLKERGAEFIGVDRQTDTYFKVKKGRLKLRTGDIENDLIYYDREDSEGPKQSDVLLFKIESGSELEQILHSSLEPLVVVNKRREIYFIGNVKFHIDHIKNLGNFVEIEAIDRDGDIGREKLLEQCNEYMRLFKIREIDLIKNSYSDMLMGK